MPPEGLDEEHGTLDSADSPSHARARTILTVEQRVSHIAGLMESLTWQRGKTAKALAEEWGLKVSTVEGHAAEASRRVCGDAEEAARDITVGARRLLRAAVINRDAKAFHAVASIWAEVAGAKAPQRQEITTATLGEATPTAAAELVRKKFGGHAAKPDPAEASPSTRSLPADTPEE